MYFDTNEVIKACQPSTDLERILEGYIKRVNWIIHDVLACFDTTSPADVPEAMQWICSSGAMYVFVALLPPAAWRCEWFYLNDKSIKAQTLLIRKYK